MLAVEKSQRGAGLGSKLVEHAIKIMEEQSADEVVLETEDVNKGSLKLYERLGFLPTKHLHRYYLNGNGALRLVLYLTDVKTKLLSQPKRTGNEDNDSAMMRDWNSPDDGRYDDDLYG
jgi:ribosomal protein S18 acetylase RimI-like enzyme